MIVVAFVRTFVIALPMLEVVSAKNITSGLGGITGVCTVFGTVKESPGLPILVTVCGSTPGFAAEAVATATTATSVTRIRTAYGRRSLSVRIILSPLTWISVSREVGKGDATLAGGSQLPVTA